MRRTVAILSLLALLSAPVAVTGCKHTPPSTSGNTAADWWALLVTGLKSAESIAALAYMEGASDQNKPVCLVGGVGKTVLGSAAEVAEHRGLVFPNVDADISLCLDIPNPETEDAKKVNDQVLQIVVEIIGNALDLVRYYVKKLVETDCVGATIGVAAIDYVHGMLQPIADEIMHPNGQVQVAGVQIDLSPCNDPNHVPEVPEELGGTPALDVTWAPDPAVEDLGTSSVGGEVEGEEVTDPTEEDETDTP